MTTFIQKGIFDLMIISTKNTLGYTNEITRYLDKYIKKEYKFSESYSTYLFDKPRNNFWLIRVPGATRGYIELNDNNIVKNIVLNRDTYCYQSDVLENLHKFLGVKLDLSNL